MGRPSARVGVLNNRDFSLDQPSSPLKQPNIRFKDDMEDLEEQDQSQRSLLKLNDKENDKEYDNNN